MGLEPTTNGLKVYVGKRLKSPIKTRLSPIAQGQNPLIIFAKSTTVLCGFPEGHGKKMPQGKCKKMPENIEFLEAIFASTKQADARS